MMDYLKKRILKIKEKYFIPVLLHSCIKTVELSTRQACLWFTCQPKEPPNLKSIDYLDMK